MAAYLITYRNYLEGVKVLKYDDLRDAEAVLAIPSNDPHMGGFAVDTNSSLAGIPAKTLVDLFNAWRDPDDKEIAKFENRTIAKNRFIVRLETKFGNLPVTQAPAKPEPAAPATSPTADDASASTEGESDMAKAAAKKEKKAKTPKANGSGREIGKPAKPVAEFRQLRAGTDRAKVLKLMNGTKTVAQIASAVEGADEKKVLTIAYCIHRDCGIGYKVDDGKLTAIYPGSRTYEDAIKSEAE